MTDHKPQPLGHLPSLDGLRAIAVLLVMWFHARPGFSGGRAGVDVFFVISGFLITALLLEEHEANSTIGLRAFYMRRALRLYPALIAGIAGALLLAAARIPIFDASTRALEETARNTPWALLYTINIPRALGTTSGGYLGHFWSLAIEEQFYIVWPLVMIQLLRHRSAAAVGWVALGCAIASTTSRTVLDLAGFRSEMLYNATFSHVDGIFAGCALAVLWKRQPQLVTRIGTSRNAAAASVVGAVVIFWGRYMSEFGFLAVVAATTVVLAYLTSQRDSMASRALSQPVATSIGKRSYGLYVYHWPIFLFIGIDRRPHILLLGFAASFIAAWVSYRIVERPFLRLKRRWSRPVSATGPIGVT